MKKVRPVVSATPPRKVGPVHERLRMVRDVGRQKLQLTYALVEAKETLVDLERWDRKDGMKMDTPQLGTPV